jgi:putative membrane protein
MWIRFLIRWLITSIAVAAAILLVPGITVAPGASAWFTIVFVALVLGFVNAIIRPILSLLSCGCIVATFGLFMLVINALMLMLAGNWANGLFNTGISIDGFWPAFWGSIVISVVSFLLSVFIPDEEDSGQLA